VKIVKILAKLDKKVCFLSNTAHLLNKKTPRKVYAVTIKVVPVGKF
jgi:hypothetical protein